MSNKTYGGTKKKKKKEIPPSRVNTAVKGVVDKVVGAAKRTGVRGGAKPTPLRMHGTTRPARSITNPTVPYDLIPRGPSIKKGVGTTRRQPPPQSRYRDR